MLQYHSQLWLQRITVPQINDALVRQHLVSHNLLDDIILLRIFPPWTID
jgi:hypothetical protein